MLKWTLVFYGNQRRSWVHLASRGPLLHWANAGSEVLRALHFLPCSQFSGGPAACTTKARLPPQPSPPSAIDWGCSLASCCESCCEWRALVSLLNCACYLPGIFMEVSHLFPLLLYIIAGSWSRPVSLPHPQDTRQKSENRVTVWTCFHLQGGVSLISYPVLNLMRKSLMMTQFSLGLGLQQIPEYLTNLKLAFRDLLKMWLCSFYPH